MSKRIKKIILTLEGIEVISEIDGINKITQMNLSGTQEEIHNIFQAHNLSDLVNYEYDEKILRALAVDERGDQLRDYLEICRQASFGMKNNELIENMPEIEYDLRSSKKHG